MGIGGLLPLLQPIQERVDIQRYRGKRVAVDVAAWLYAGLVTARKGEEGEGEANRSGRGGKRKRRLWRRWASV